MCMVEVQNIKKNFGRILAVDNASFKVKRGELLGLLGPSGCGKTTLLRIISGLINPDQGVIFMDGKVVTALPPEKRPTSLVFQNYALFPHLSVFENIAFGLRIKKLRMKEIRKEVQNILEIVGLLGTENRSIRQLSGGQQQRIALARALVMKPSVLLLDEPLSNLDAKLRLETRLYIQKIQKALGITSIFVTHDQEEALSISDRIVIMNKGKIVQIGTPEEIYSKPNSKFTAYFIGKSNILSGNIRSDRRGNGLFTLASGQVLRVKSDIKTGTKCSLVIRPEYIQLLDEAKENENNNIFVGWVEHITYLGEINYYRIRLEGNETLLVSEYACGVSKKLIGEKVFISWPISACLVLQDH